MGVFQNNLMGAAAAAASAGGGDFYSHQIANSCRFGVVNSYLTRSISGVTNNTQNTISFWVKRSKISGSAANSRQPVMGNSGGAGQLEFVDADTFRYASYGTLESNVQLFRDISAWYHIHIYRSTSNGSGAIYVNGVQVSLTTNTAGSAGIFQNGQSLQIGASNNGSTVFDGYIADVYGIYDQNIAHTEFGEFKNGVWIPKDASSAITFGSHDFHLKFESSSDLGNDSSGNNNDFTATNMSAHDQMLDSPTFNSDSNGGNFATYNPLQEKGDAAALMVLTEGNLEAESVTNDKYHQITGNMGVKTGKWYIEWYIKAAGYPSWAVGWNHGNFLGTYTGNSGLASIANMQYMGYFTGNNVYITNFGNTSTGDPQYPYSSFTNQGAPTTGDVIMCAIDNDAGKCWWGINGVWGNIGSGIGNPATGANATATWTVANYTDYKFPFTLSWANPVAEIVMNCGQEGTFGGAITAGGNADDTGYGNFKYDVPAGFLSLCSGNLPVADEIDPAQTDDNYPQKQFNMLQYTGNGSERTIDTGFQIDMAWARSTVQGQDWYVLDTSRGFFGASSNNKYLKLNVYPGQAEATLPQYNFKAQSGSDITITGGTWLNSGGHTQQMWNWKGNGGTTSTPSGGSLATTVQVNTDAGFSIIQYVGDGGTSAFTLAHGLGKKPSVVLFKDRDSNSNNNGYHVFPINTSLPANSYFYTSDSDAGNTSTSGTISNSTTTDTVLGINRTSSSGGGRTISENGDNFLMYAWAEIEGFSKFSVYLGNGLADGTFVYCGFKPAFIAIKNYDEAHNWRTYDLLNDPYNLAYHYLELNTNSAINSSSNTTDIDILSNGFKIRGDASTINGSGDRYFFMAWASNPFKYATAR